MPDNPNTPIPNEPQVTPDAPPPLPPPPEKIPAPAPELPVATVIETEPPKPGASPIEPPVKPIISPAQKNAEKKPPRLLIGSIILFLFLASIPITMYLLNQRQDIGEKAAVSDCDSHGGFASWDTDCDCGRNPPDGELINMAVCYDGTRILDTPTGQACAAGSCGGGDTLLNNCLREECDTVNFSPGHEICIEQWQRSDGSTYEKPGSDTGKTCTSATGWAQCSVTDGPEPILPCGSCSVNNVAAGSLTFACELDCGGLASGCPGGSAGTYSITHRWERCSQSSNQACTPDSPDYLESGDLGGPGPWSINGQSTTAGSGSFPVPDPINCGRVQVDVQMTASGTSVAAGVYDTGQNCASGVVPTPTPTPTPTSAPGGTTPTPTASCLAIKAYDTSWTLLDAVALANLTAGETVRFATIGQTNSGSFIKARFTVNGILLPETANKKPGTEEFYTEYIVPTGTTSFMVTSEVFHETLGWQ
ncbi:MAG: hypothetical protein Q8Q15_04180 [bacterium]|nr:hypothetical protein [bacterium]